MKVASSSAEILKGVLEDTTVKSPALPPVVVMPVIESAVMPVFMIVKA